MSYIDEVQVQDDETIGSEVGYFALCDRPGKLQIDPIGSACTTHEEARAAFHGDHCDGMHYVAQAWMVVKTA